MNETITSDKRLKGLERRKHVSDIKVARVPRLRLSRQQRHTAPTINNIARQRLAYRPAVCYHEGYQQRSTMIRCALILAPSLARFPFFSQNARPVRGVGRPVPAAGTPPRQDPRRLPPPSVSAQGLPWTKSHPRLLAGGFTVRLAVSAQAARQVQRR